MKSADLLKNYQGQPGVDDFLSLKKTVIAFDVHGVLFDFNYKKLFAIVCAGLLFSLLSIELFGLHRVWPFLFLPLFFWVFLGCWYFSHAKLYGYAPAVERYFQGESFFKRLLLRNWLFFANLFVPNKKSFELAWDLKARGFKLIVASNVGKQAWEELKEAYASFFVRGDDYLFDDYFHLNGRQWWSNPADGVKFAQGWLTKTHKDYFEGLHTFVVSHIVASCEQVILIDNNSKVISRALGEKGERFRFSVLFKNPEDARNRLIASGALKELVCLEDRSS